MKYYFTFLCFVITFSSFSQRLYLHDIENGNYKSYDIGEKIDLILFDSIKNVKGTITGFQADGIVLNDTSIVKLSQIAGVLKHTGKYTVGRVLLIVLGSYMMVTGLIYGIAGVSLIALKEPFGGIMIGVGAVLGIGGLAVVNKQVKKARGSDTLLKNNDNITYRLFVE